MKLFVEMELPNFSNVRWHWRKKAKVVAEQRAEVEIALAMLDPEEWAARLDVAPNEDRPWKVTLTRYGWREMDDDGVVSSLKPTRDAIAAFVGVDDKHRHIVRYVYEQKVVNRSEPVGVEISIEVAS